MTLNNQHAPRRVAVLGSTGSIGVQTLEVAENLGMPVTALAAHSNVTLAEQQVRKFLPALAVMYDEKAAADLRVRVGDLPVRIAAGMDGLCEAAGGDTDIVLTAVSGMVGLRPTMAAIAAGHDIALANKETLVAGGEVVMDAVRKSGVRLLPVDSEHSAIFQCLAGSLPDDSACTADFKRRRLKSITLTASGGPFFGKTADELVDITVEQALRHPNWSMGAKITIDSATMMNKGLELIEARWLFDVAPENINIVVHRESIVHSLIEYEDNSTVAQLGLPDMHIPIQYALTFPGRAPSPVGRLDLAALGGLHFARPDEEVFVCTAVCREAIRRGGLVPAAVNAAGERAVELFLNREIGFLDIGRLVSRALDYPVPPHDGTVEQITALDRDVRAWIRPQDCK